MSVAVLREAYRGRAPALANVPAARDVFRKSRRESGLMIKPPNACRYAGYLPKSYHDQKYRYSILVRADDTLPSRSELG
jgi:hypothetical protein